MRAGNCTAALPSRLLASSARSVAASKNSTDSSASPAISRPSSARPGSGPACGPFRLSRGFSYRYDYFRTVFWTHCTHSVSNLNLQTDEHPPSSRNTNPKPANHRLEPQCICRNFSLVLILEAWCCSHHPRSFALPLLSHLICLRSCFYSFAFVSNSVSSRQRECHRMKCA